MERITETIRCMVRLADSAILEVAICWSSAFSRLTDALKAKIKPETIEQPKRASGRSFASVVTRKRPSLNRAGNGEGKMADDKWRMADDGCEMRSGGCGDGESGDPPPQAPSEEMSQEDRDSIYGPSLERMSRGFTRMGQR